MATSTPCKRINALLLALACVTTTTFAQVKWVYDDSGAKATLTEILPDGSSDTPWQFYLTAAGVLSKVTFGTSKHIDLSDETLPSGAPSITSIAGSTFQGATVESIIYPTTIQTFGGNLFYQSSTLTNICFQEPSTFSNMSYSSNPGRIFPSTIRWMNIPASVTAFSAQTFMEIPGKTTPATIVFDGDMPDSNVTSLFSTSTGANYDYYLRILIDLAGHPAWQNYLNSSAVTKWADLDDSVKAQFYAKYPNEPHPYALVTTAGDGMRLNSWIAENIQDNEFLYDDGYIATMDDSVTTNWVNGNLVYKFTDVNIPPVGKLRSDMTLKEILVVGGGGAGGGALGGGGGGGGVVGYVHDYPLTSGAPFTMSIGKGGEPAVNNKGAYIVSQGKSGLPTTLSIAGETFVAFGGGGGGYSAGGQKNNSYPSEGTLGSGGGAAMRTSVKAADGVDYTAEQGYPGGSSSVGAPGGGGGFSAAGTSGQGSTLAEGQSGNGGEGFTTTIYGSTEVYGSGGGAGGGGFYDGGGHETYTGKTAGVGGTNAGDGGQEVAGASAAAGFGGGGGGGGTTVSGSTNTSYLGGFGGSGCVILVFSIGVDEAQPAVDNVSISFPNGCTQPQISVELGGEGAYAATVRILCGTGSLAQAGTEYECVRTFTSVANGDTVVALADFYPNPGEQVYAKVEVSATGAQDVTETADATASGIVPDFVGHGGDPAKVIHVRDGATGKATGRNWADAYPDFRAALKELGETRNELWYCGSNTLTVASAETVTPTYAATVRGGFAGIEDSAAERTAGAMSTIDGENLFDTFELVNANAFSLDGFRFIHAKNRAVKKTGAGNLVIENCEFDDNGNEQENVVARAINATGDGESTRVTIGNCRISRHFELHSKLNGTMAVQIKSVQQAIVDGCTFVSNGTSATSPYQCSVGNGVALRAEDAPLLLRNSRFVGNVCSISYAGVGSVVSVLGASGGSVIENCLFACNELIDTSANNTPGDSVAGTLRIELDEATSTCLVRNCTFASNLYAIDEGTAGLSAVNGNVEVVNSIFFGNIANLAPNKYAGHTAAADIHVNDGATVSVRYSLFGDAAGCTCAAGGTLSAVNCIYEDPLFVTTTNEVATCIAANGSRFSGEQYDSLIGFNAHLRSRHGYTDEITGDVVKYPGMRSPAVDAGDPSSSRANEAKPNGGRVNLGFYGNTPWATMSAANAMLLIVQ